MLSIWFVVPLAFLNAACTSRSSWFPNCWSLAGRILSITLLTCESEVAQLCPTLCDPMDCSLPGSSIHGIFQARVLEWIAISSPGDLPDPGIEPRSPVLQTDALPLYCLSHQGSYCVNWVQLCGTLNILWHCLSLGLEWKLTFSSPVATAEFSKFAGILSAAL